MFFHSFVFFLHCSVMGKSYFLMKIGKKVLFSRIAQKVLGRGVKRG